MTADEFLISKNMPGFAKHTLMKDWLKEFAQLHVEAALKSASLNLKQPACITNAEFTQQRQSILNAYSPSNIK